MLLGMRWHGLDLCGCSLKSPLSLSMCGTDEPDPGV